MRQDPLVLQWQQAIISDAEAKLKRPLRDFERQFIVSRGSLISLEAIHDSVKANDPTRLELYLGSECQDPAAGDGGGSGPRRSGNA
ncbi:MAG TPA: hypothetical protein VG457_07420 [Planctomycetota bacterium]|jgi:hypothetical protein|nr:hypothetical protein [Planctomycetota bacterium]